MVEASSIRLVGVDGSHSVRLVARILAVFNLRCLRSGTLDGFSQFDASLDGDRVVFHEEPFADFLTSHAGHETIA